MAGQPATAGSGVLRMQLTTTGRTDNEQSPGLLALRIKKYNAPGRMTAVVFRVWLAACGTDKDVENSKREQR